MMKTKINVMRVSFASFLFIISSVGCSAPLTSREKGGLMGFGFGAGSGAIIGSTAGHAAVGALVGGPVGLIGGAFIGDQLMRR
jgi:Glycine zipper